MSERLSVPTQSWRPPRRERLFDRLLDPQMRRMALVACGAAAILALGVAAYSAIASRPRGVPVIEADSRPLRVRPDNPGGLQVAGAEEQIMGAPGNGAAAGHVDVMAPAPEMPQPQMLRAQIQAARQPAPVQPASPAPPAPVAQAVEPRPALPTADKVAMVHPAIPAATPAVGGGHEVQLAAVDTQHAAMEEWQRLARRMPELMGARRPSVLKAERDGKVFYRLRTGGFADTAQATAFCVQVKAKGGGCAIATF